MRRVACLCLLISAIGSFVWAEEIPEFTIWTVAGVGSFGMSGDGGPAIEAEMNRPTAVALDSEGNLYIADSLNRRVRRVDGEGVITTVVGTGKGSPQKGDHPAMATNLVQPYGIAVDRDGVLYVLNRGHSKLLRVDADGIARTIAGNGRRGFGGDGGPATEGQLSGSNHLVVDRDGTIYIADAGNHRIRRVTTDGVISTWAGTGDGGHGGDGGPAIEAQLNHPSAIAMDGEGSLFIADFSNHRIRKITAAGVITTIAGTGDPKYNGDGIPATEANIGEPTGVAVSRDGYVYVSDQVNDRIRVVTPGGTIYTVAGTGERGYTGDGGPAHEALINIPDILCTDGEGNVYFPDHQNFVVRKLTLTGTRRP